MGEKRGAYRVFVGKLEGKKPLRRNTLSWEGNIKMALQEIEWEACSGLIWLSIEICGGF